MWWKSKRKNRRFEREHILDVKVESRQLRSMRLQAAAVLLARVVGTATILFLLWRGSDWFLNEFLFTNPAFAIRRIDAETDGILTPAKLLECAGVKEGDNLLALDLSRIQRELEYFPWIQSAAVERVRPNKLRIRVIEREPIAQATLFEPGSADGKARTVVFYFDAQGYVMLPLNCHPFEAAAFGFDALPTLTGIAGVDLRPGRRLDSPQIQAALRLIAQFSRSPMFGLVDLTTVDLSMPQLLQVSTAQGAVVTFALENADLQLRRWRLVYDRFAPAGKAVVTLDLSVSNNVPARLIEASIAPPARPKFVKPSAYKKKHV